MEGGAFWDLIRGVLPKFDFNRTNCESQNVIEKIPDTEIYTVKPKLDILTGLRRVDTTKKYTIVFVSGFGSSIDLTLSNVCYLMYLLYEKKDRT